MRLSVIFAENVLDMNAKPWQKSTQVCWQNQTSSYFRIIGILWAAECLSLKYVYENN